MTKSEKDAVLKALTTLALALRQDVSDQTQQIYLERLKGLPTKAVLKAIERTIDTWKFNTYPPIGVIRELAGAGEDKQALEDRAALAWEQLRNGRCGRAYNQDALSCPITKKCFQALGGSNRTLTGFGMWNIEQEHWKRKQFIELYQTHARNQHLDREFDQIESQGILQQISQVHGAGSS